MATTDKVVVDIITNSDKSQTSMLKYAAAAGTAAVAIGAIIKVGKELVDAYAVQEQAEARLEATIKATGSAAGLTKTELTNMASGLQGVTKFGDEAIIGAESLLLTFKNVGEDTFPRALESILDVSEAMGTDLKASSIQLGKALNDPVGGIAALNRVGIQFTDDQKATIKSMMDMNDVSGAQGIILDELEGQFGGVARAAGQTATASFTQLNNATGDLKEQLGQSIAEGLQPFAEATTNLVSKLTNWIEKNRGISDFLDDMADGSVTATRRIEELQDVIDAGAKAAGRKKIFGDEYTQNLIDAGKEAQRLLAGILMNEALEKRYADAIKTRETEQIAAAKFEMESNAAKINSIEKLEELRIASLTTDERKLELIQAEINELLKYSDVPEVMELINELAKERNSLREEGNESLGTLMATEESNNAMLEEYANQRMIESSRALNGIDNQAEAIEELAMDYEALAGSMITSFASAFKEVGAGNSTLWKGMKDGAMDAISNILEAFAAQWIVQAIAAGASLNFVSAAGYTAAAAGAYAASGLVQSFATGGSFIADNPQLIQVGEGAGSERVTVDQASGSTGGSERIYASVDGGDGFWMTLQRGVDNRKLRIPERSIVS